MSGQIFQGNHLIAETNDAPLGFEQGGIEVTQAQYDQLVEDDNVAEDTNYYITDTKVIMRNNEKYGDASKAYNVVANKTVLFIGDSYGDSTAVANPWPEKVLDILTFKKYYKLCTGGHGFTGKDGATSGTTGATLRWITDLTNFVNSHEAIELAEITDVYIVGGFNDIYSTYTTIKSYMSAFFTYAHTNIPNAKFHLGMAGWCDGMGGIVTPNIAESQAQIKERLWKVIQAYSECGEYNCCYIGDLYLTLHSYGLDFDNSKYHPSAIGAQKLANAIASYIVGQNFTVQMPETAEVFTVTELDGQGGTTESEQIVCYASQQHNIISANNFGNSTSSGATRFTVTPLQNVAALGIWGLTTLGTTADKVFSLKSGLITGKSGNGSFGAPITIVVNGTTIARGWWFISGSGFLSIIPEIALEKDVPIDVIIRPFTISAKLC